jgi:hypothetical protein
MNTKDPVPDRSRVAVRSGPREGTAVPTTQKSTKATAIQAIPVHRSAWRDRLKISERGRCGLPRELSRASEAPFGRLSCHENAGT